MTSTLVNSMKSEHGYIAPGWRRWVRAREAALERPNTYHAALYLHRTGIASQFSWDYVLFSHWTKTSYSKAVWTCSAFCAAMQVQLGQQKMDYESVHLQVRSLSRAWPDRPVHCYVCNATLLPNGTRDDEKREWFLTPDAVVTVAEEPFEIVSAGSISNGIITTEEEAPAMDIKTFQVDNLGRIVGRVTMVTLEPTAAEFFEHYLTPEQRLNWMEIYGL